MAARSFSLMGSLSMAATVHDHHNTDWGRLKERRTAATMSVLVFARLYPRLDLSIVKLPRELFQLFLISQECEGQAIRHGGGNEEGAESAR